MGDFVLKAKYQVYKDTGGKYRFRLRAANNKIIAVSEAYQSKASCINGVRSVQSNCNSHVEDKTAEMKELTHPKYELFTDVASKFRFNLKASNGEIIVALVHNEEATVKRFFLKDNAIELHPENETYPIMRYNFDEVLVQGKVVGLVRGPEQAARL